MYINLAFFKYFFWKKNCFLEIWFIKIIIEFVIENSQNLMCWDVEEEGICTIYVWYITMLKWEEHEYDFFNLETWLWKYTKLWSKYEPKYGNGWIRGGKVWPNVSFDTQIVNGTQGRLMWWESHTMDENETTWGKKTKNTKALGTSWGSSIYCPSFLISSI